MSVYLDYNASAPIDPRVLEIMIDVYRSSIGNADSRTHDYGDQAKHIVEDSRKKVAQILKINSDEVFFTSGATESNNIIIQGLREYGVANSKQHIITSSIEHKAVLETVRAMERDGFEVDYIKPQPDGRVSAEQVLERVKDETLLVSIMHVNNETGMIQPVQEIGEALADQEIFFHVDATQSFGKLVDELQNLRYDMLSMSAHKLGGPQGIGVMVLRRKNYKLPPVKAISYGGQQEHGLRPGTIPTALTAGLGKACEIAAAEYKEHTEYCREIKEILISLLDQSELEYVVNGDTEYCMPTTLNVCIKGVSSEALMLSTQQFCAVSNGSACTSSSYKPSYVLTEMGLSPDKIDNSIRISWGPGATKEAIVQNFKELLRTAKNLKM